MRRNENVVLALCFALIGICGADDEEFEGSSAKCTLRRLVEVEVRALVRFSKNRRPLYYLERSSRLEIRVLTRAVIIVVNDFSIELVDKTMIHSVYDWTCA